MPFFSFLFLIFFPIHLIRSKEGEMNNTEVQFKSEIDQLEVEVSASDSATAALNNLKMK
jgi:hypothetical protein